MISDLATSRKAAGIDFTPAEQYVTRLGAIGDRLKALERSIVSFDDHDLALKIDHAFQSQSVASAGIGQSVLATQVSSIQSQTQGLNEMTNNDTRFTWLYVLSAGVVLLLVLLWVSLRKTSTAPFL